MKNNQRRVYSLIEKKNKKSIMVDLWFFMQY